MRAYLCGARGRASCAAASGWSACKASIAAAAAGGLVGGRGRISMQSNSIPQPIAPTIGKHADAPKTRALPRSRR